MNYEIELLEMKKNLRVSSDLPHKIGLPNFKFKRKKKS